MKNRLAGLSALLVLGAGLLASPAGAGEASFKVKAIKDVAYHTGEGAHATKHKLDLFLPEGGKDFPVFFFVHGGAWRTGDKGFLGIYSALGKFYARHGIGAVVINYRLSPGVKHPAHVEDVARAFAWTYKNIARYGGDPGRIFLCGHSAGGHLTALLATAGKFLAPYGLSPAEAVRGVIPISGVYEIPEKFLASVFGEDPKRHKDASPIAHVHKGLPPFLILYADHDFPGCGKEPSEAFARALGDKDNVVRTQEITDSNHYQIILSAALPDTPVSDAILKFIEKHGKKSDVMGKK